MTAEFDEGYSALVPVPGNTAHKVRVTPIGLDLDGDPVPLISGEIHYFQHDGEQWERLLDEAKDLGLSCISTYIPWGRHEPSRERYDFGEHDSSLDVERFIELVASKDFHLIVRPGPHINAELNWLGYPRHVLEDEESWARTPGGNPVWLPINPRPIPIPSYASKRFLEAVDRWLTEIGRRLVPLQWPEGPIVAVQLDNEAPLLFRNGPFDQDYHPDTIAWYRDYTAQRGRPATAPPTTLDADEPAALLPVIDWIECKNQIFARALRRMRATFERIGLDRVVFSHNIAQSGVVPEVSPTTFDAVELAGFDFYHQRSRLRLIRDRCLYVTGSYELPFAAELGVGGPWNLPARSNDDTLIQMRAAIALGFRGFNLFMTADRDRYYGSPLAARPVRRQRALARELSKLVKAFKRKQLHTLKLRAPVAIVIPRLYPMLSHATWTLGPFGPPVLQVLGLTPPQGTSEDCFGFSRPLQSVWFQDLCRLTAALSAEGVGWVIVDGDAAIGRLPALSPEVVVALTYEAVDGDLWSGLISYAEQGRELVIGPERPSLDAEMKPLVTSLTREGACQVNLKQIDFSDSSSCAELARRVASRPQSAPFVVADDEGLEFTVLERDGVAQVVGVLELEGRKRQMPLKMNEEVELRDLVEGTPITGNVVSIEPYGVCLMEIVRAEGETT